MNPPAADAVRLPDEEIDIDQDQIAADQEDAGPEQDQAIRGNDGPEDPHRIIR